MNAGILVMGHCDGLLGLCMKDGKVSVILIIRFILGIVVSFSLTDNM